jgi:PAS domain S-box-containing protein
VKILAKFGAIIAVSLAASIFAYFAPDAASPARTSLLIAACAGTICQIGLAIFFSRQLDEERNAAIEIADRLYKRQFKGKNDAAFSDVMQELEDLFRETLRRERKVVENAADVICLVSTEGTILSANPACKTVFGYNSDELVGRKLSDFNVAENEENSLNPLLGGDESIQKIALENQFRKKDGTVIDLLWSAHWSATDNGLFCVAHDITERKHAERLLKESEERLRMILESLPAGICVLGLTGTIKFMNHTARQICLPTGNLAGNRLANAFFNPCTEPFSISKFTGELQSASDPKVIRDDGTELPVEISAREISWEENPACLVMFVDVSEKRAAEKVKQQFLDLRQKLMDMVAHDIRAPLQSLLSTQEILLKCNFVLEEKFRKKLEICQDEVKRIIRLINDLLRISRHEATRLNLQLAENEIEPLIKQAVASINDLAMERSVRITAQTVNAKVNVDSDRILQVLFNLLSNAVKYSPSDSSITVVSKLEPKLLRISVIDQGRGIPAGAESSLFTPYSQVSWTDSATKGGTGLGLSICREIVEEHGGQIGVENNETGGACFWFTLPIQS